MKQIAKFKKRIFDLACQSILKTPPVRCQEDTGVVILTQTYHPDLMMCIVALKSFARYVTPKYFFIVDDGLLDSDRKLLSQQLTNVEYISAKDVEVGACPRGGCWERLVSISKICPENYIIQVDSDTVTVASPDEVLACVEQNRCFTLPTMQGRNFISIQEASEFAHHVESEHIQILAERALIKLPEAIGGRYIRGCAGFAGFARGSYDFNELESFSRHMEEIIGADQWHKWGSEQVSSNFIIANANAPCALSFERYPYYHPDINLNQARLIHFIGSHRFHGVEYIRRARQFIRAS